jgi:prefoldin alpha subunit
MTKEMEQKLQEKYILYQLLQQNIESLNQQFGLVENQLVETKISVKLLDDIKKLNAENEILLPLGSGCFGKGKITEKNGIIVNLGSGIMVEKTAESAKLFLEKGEKELEKMNLEIKEQMEKIARQMNEIGIDIQNLAKKQQ